MLFSLYIFLFLFFLLSCSFRGGCWQLCLLFLFKILLFLDSNYIIWILLPFHSVVLSSHHLSVIQEELFFQFWVPEMLLFVHEHLHVFIQALDFVHSVIVHLVNCCWRRIVRNDFQVMGFVHIFHNSSESTDSLDKY